MTKEQKSPEQIASEIVEYGMRMSASNGFDSMRDRMISFIAQAIKSERDKLEKAKAFIKAECYCEVTDCGTLQCEHCNFLEELK